MSAEHGTCTSCNAPLVWLTMVRADSTRVRHPFNARAVTAWVVQTDGTVAPRKSYVSHFATCKHPDEHRRPA